LGGVASLAALSEALFMQAEVNTGRTNVAAASNMDNLFISSLLLKAYACG
jgi:hypothetical protein